MSEEEIIPEKLFGIIDVAQIDWHEVLNIFLRVLSLVTLTRALLQWAIIIGIYDFNGTVFVDLSTQVQSYILFCALVGIIAGVGLWMLNKWGSALWLFVIVVKLVIDFTSIIIPQALIAEAGRGFLFTLFDILLIIAYFGFSTQNLLIERKHIRI
jgi:hypothetical protein